MRFSGLTLASTALAILAMFHAAPVGALYLISNR
jgi:hypothetical protein